MKKYIETTLDALFEDLAKKGEVDLLTQKKLFAAQIQQAMARQKMTQADLAHAMRTSRTVVHRGLVDVARNWRDCRDSSKSALRPGSLEGRLPRRAGWANVSRIVARKLDMLDYAAVLSDLASPPGSRLEALRGDLAGLYSIRVNDQWRIVFRWPASGPCDVDVRDYH